MIRITLFLLMVPFFLSAQTKTLSIENASSPSAGFFPPAPSQLQWRGKTDSYAFIYKNILTAGKPGVEKRDSLIRLNDINNALAALKVEPVKRFPAIKFVDGDHFRFSLKNKFFIFNLQDKTVVLVNSIDENAVNVDIEENTNRIAYTKDNNLFISENGKETSLTNETNPGIVYGSERVHRNEFGITKGTFWSPDGNKLAFYRMDETMVADYPLVDISTRIATLVNTKYPMAGMKSHHVTLGVYDLATRNTLYLETGGDPEHYLTNITWGPDGKFIYIAELNRDQNHMLLNKYDALTGKKIKTLFEETSEKYVEPLTGLFFLNKDPQKFLWLSQKDGFNHIYLYDTEGKLIRQVTSGEWVVTDILDIDPRDQVVFFTSNKSNPIDQQVFSANLIKNEIKLLTPEPGTHTGFISGDGKFILDRFSSLKIFTQIELRGEKEKDTEIIFTGQGPLKDYNLGETNIFTIKSEKGDDLYCGLIKPINFDSTKKYPVIIYVYGGPHSQLITDSWLGGAGLFLNYLAEQGYVVFTLDNRGTSNRGAAFEQVIFRNLGTAEVSDQMKGVEYLKSLPYVDSKRIGINGWSYGGFMTISMLLKNPGVFKTAVAGGPVVDWKWYEVMYGERYMDTPESNPEGYKNASLLNYVKDLNSKLLIIQGYQDGTVVPQNSLSFLKKCVDENKQVDYFVYPGHEHNVSGKDRTHLNQKIVDYFRENL